MRTQCGVLAVIRHLLVSALLVQGDIPTLGDPLADAIIFAGCQEKPQSSFPVYNQPLQLVGMLRGYSEFKTLFTRPSIDHNLDASSFQTLSSTFHQLLSKYADRVDWLDGQGADGRSWFPKEITSDMTYAGLTAQLETAPDASSLRQMYAASVTRLNFLHRKRVGLVGSRAMLATYDALFDRCIVNPLDEDAKQFTKPPENLESSPSSPQVNNPPREDANAIAQNTEIVGGKLLWVMVYVVPAGLFTAFLVLMERHIRHQNRRWRPLLQRRWDSDGTPSDDVSPTAALFLQQLRVAPELMDASVADLVTNTIVPRRGSTDLAASVNHPD